MRACCQPHRSTRFLDELIVISPSSSGPNAHLALLEALYLYMIAPPTSALPMAHAITKNAEKPPLASLLAALTSAHVRTQVVCGKSEIRRR